MNNEKILFIAYVACKAKKVLVGSNPHLYYSAIALISINFLIHLVQIIMLIKPGFLLKNFNSPSGCFLMAGFSILLIYLLGKVFSKKVLARGIKTYKESKVSSNASIIAFGYLILNIVPMSLIAGIRS